MGDFLLDFRPTAQRQLAGAANFLRFFPDLHVTVIDEPEFGLVLTSPDDQHLWGSCRTGDGEILVALCGRVALERQDWEDAKQLEVTGGLACRHILKCYREGNLERVAGLSGNFVIILCDRAARKCFLVTDRWGVSPAYSFNLGRQLVFSSHPDALADASGETANLDLTSLAEFILTCRLTYPHTYYQRIRSLPMGSLTTVDFAEVEAPKTTTRAYFNFNHDPQPKVNQEELADEFAAAFRNAVITRSLPQLGRSAVALSGGLDSRAVLCAAAPNPALVGFCCYDEENTEFHTARAIAKATGVDFVPLRRGFDYYGDNAMLGVRISAGMGCIASNHFLGFREELKNMGVANLLTGCYCDYVFKGLALNKRVNRWTTKESAGDFSFSYYAPHFTEDTESGRAVRQRLESLFPENLRNYDTEERIAEVERRRMFPFCYEMDNAQRMIVQRVMGWPVPIADNGLMSVYLKMPTEAKLNRQLFKKMVARVCQEDVLLIPDANTGAPINAGLGRVAVNSHLQRLKNKVAKLQKSIATNESWPNWSYYVTHSPKIRELWSRPNPEAFELFRQLLGPDRFSPEIEDYGEKRLWLFLQLFTLKLWFDQRP